MPRNNVKIEFVSYKKVFFVFEKVAKSTLSKKIMPYILKLGYMGFVI